MKVGTVKNEATDVNSELDRYGRSIKIELDNYFTSYGSAISYQKVFTKYSTAAKRLNLGLTEFAHLLSELNYIKLICTPNNRRYVISSQCDWSPEAMLDHIMEIDSKA